MPSDRRRKGAWWPWLLAAGALLPVVWVVNALVPRPSNLGVQGQRLAACPDSPNCVSSQADDPAHRVEPLAFTGEPADALARLRQTLDALPGARRVTATADYLHYEFRTPLCRFVDDVECLLAPGAGVIHVRSASRLGYSDLGANRKRVEAIRRRFAPGPGR